MRGRYPHSSVVVVLVAQVAVGFFLFGCSQEPSSPSSPSRGASAQGVTGGGSGGNHPPIVRAAKIFPESVTVDTELRVDVQGEDMDGDAIAYRYQWLVNGAAVSSEGVARFKPAQLKNGDRIAVELTPNDGKVDGAVYVTDAVTVGNSAPDISEIHVQPSSVHRGEQITVTAVAGDPDGDPVTLSYKWFCNNKEIPGANAAALDTKDFRKKDVLSVLVMASDGKSTREGRAGLPVTIENSPPRFTSTPPAEIKDGQYLYQVVVVDPDDDPITLEIKQGPPGMTLDAATKQIVWKLTPQSVGKHRIVIVAKDNDNAVTQQEFDLDAQLPPPAAASK